MSVPIIKASDFRDGPYLLTRNITNPKADRRCKNDWRVAVTIPKGRFYVKILPGSVWKEGHEDDQVTIRLTPDTGGRHYDYSAHAVLPKTHSVPVGPKASLSDLLLLNLEEDRTLEGLLRYARAEHYVYGRDVLARLVSAGALTEDAVRVAVHAEIEVQALQEELDQAESG